jgi:hypothetical protein
MEGSRCFLLGGRFELGWGADPQPISPVAVHASTVYPLWRILRNSSFSGAGSSGRNHQLDEHYQTASRML